jgi:non-specific serine/threonine protein kinase/serine/threonine-protein kinase
MDKPQLTAKAVFDCAHEIDSPAERQAYLAQACADAPELRQKVEALLKAYEEAGSFLEKPPMAEAGATSDLPQGRLVSEQDLATAPQEGPGTRIGPYKLLQKLGEGGMGTVYTAEQEHPVKRRVALKVIKPGMDSAQVVRRFQAEEQALALMDHTNIAKVLDAGLTATGRPYFVMDLVKGEPITKYCDTVHLPIRDRLALFTQVCAAIQHAHQKGIIHRDIKPSNILVCMQDGQPVPKVIDFGVAKALHQKLTEQTMYTEIGSLVGTLEYMSPEQAELSAMDIDTRADVYALGVLLYELLTGSTPLDRKRLRRAAYSEAVRVIREEEPPKPSTRLTQSKESLASLAAQRRTEPARLTREVRGEIDWIVMKCLEKDRSRRYETANGLARDVQRYLADEPVEACPPSARYRLRKLARKHNKVFITAAAFVVLVVGAAVVSIILAVRATRAEANAVRAWNEEAVLRQEAEEQRQRAEENERQAKASEAEAKAVQTFFQDKVLVAPQLPEQGGLGKDVTVLRALNVARADLTKAFRAQPLTEAAIRHVLGLTYLSIGEYPVAVQEHERSLALRQAELGADHLDTLTSMHDLGKAYIWAGKPDRAVPLLEETLRRRKGVLGPEHIDTLQSMNMLAGAYHLTGRRDLVLPLREETFELRKATLGPGHRSTLIAMIALAQTYRSNGMLDKALPMAVKVVKLTKAHLGPEDYQSLVAMMEFGRCLLEAQRPAEAEPVLRECLGISQKKLADAWETFHAQTLLGGSLLGQQKYAEAESLLLQGYEGLKQREATIPAHHKPHLTEVLECLVQLYGATGRSDKVDEWRRKLEETGAAAKPPAKL